MKRLLRRLRFWDACPYCCWYGVLFCLHDTEADREEQDR